MYLYHTIVTFKFILVGNIFNLKFNVFAIIYKKYFVVSYNKIFIWYKYNVTVEINI